MKRGFLIGVSVLSILSAGCCASNAPPRFFRIEHRRVHEVLPLTSNTAAASASNAAGSVETDRAAFFYTSDALLDGETLTTKANEYRAFVITYEQSASDYRFSFLLLGPETTVQVSVDGADLYVMSGFIYIRGHWGRVRGERVFAGTTGSTLMMQVETIAGQPIDRVFFEEGVSAGIERISDGRREWWSNKTQYKEITAGGISTRIKPSATDPLGVKLAAMRKSAAEFEID